MSTLQIADAAQRAEALRLDQHVLAVAPAGSGKTGLLVRRALRALATVDQPEAVLAITFTNKAAAEIRARMLAALRMAAAGTPPAEDFQRGLYEDARQALAQDTQQGWDLLDNPARINATTIDAFNQRLASQLPLLSGLGGRAVVADAPAALYEAATTRIFERVDHADTDAEDRSALLAILDWANNRLDSAIPAIADLLARRDQWLMHRPQLLDGPQADEQVIRAVIEDTLGAARDAMPADIRSQLLQAVRIGAYSAPLLADVVNAATDAAAWPGTTAADLPAWRLWIDLLMTKDRGHPKLRASVNKNNGFPADAEYKPPFVQALKALADCPGVVEALDAVRDLPLPEYPEQYAQLRTHLGRVLTLAAGELLVEFAESGQLDYPQIAMAARQAASGEAGPEALRRSDLELRHLLVDEMQDTSDTQIDLLVNLTSDWQPGDGRSVFIVGDPQQSIYAFRKADVRLFQHLIDTQMLGHLPLSVQRLSTNFRSHASLVDWFNDELAKPFPAQADLWAGAVCYNPAAAAPGKPATSAGESVTILPIPEKSAVAEAAVAAYRVADLLAELKPGETIGLLGAARGHLAPVLTRLAAMGIDQVQATDLMTLESCRAVSDFVQLVRALRQPEDRLAWAAVLRAPFVGLAWADLVAISRSRVTLSWPQRIAQALADPPQSLSGDGLARLRKLAKALAQVEALRPNVADAAWALWNGLGGTACIEHANDAEAVALALRCVRQHQRGGEIEDWPVLQKALDTLYRPPGAGPIQAMTIHKSKGLQFDHVVLVGCGRAPRSEDRPPLQLLSLPHGVLLAPKPAESADDVRDEAGPGEYALGTDIYDFAHALHVQARRNERLRVLYVAATRAVQSLTLVAEATHGKEGWKPAKHSFAELLWQTIAPAFDELAPPDDEDAATVGIQPMPLRARLPADYLLQQPRPDWYPQERRTLRPSEQVLSQSEDADNALGEDGDRYAQLVGSMYHESIERLAHLGADAWDASAARGSLESGLRRMGMPDDQLETAIDRIAWLVQQTLDDEHGRWVIAPESAQRTWARNEYALAGWQDGQWVSAIIDRCFEQIEDGQTTLWVIDYKAAAYPVDDDEAYVEKMRAKYAPQLTEYAKFLTAMRSPDSVKVALYLPAVKRLSTLSVGATPLALP